jgi:hypothetical protein
MNILHLIGDNLSFGSCQANVYSRPRNSPYAGAFLRLQRTYRILAPRSIRKYSRAGASRRPWKVQ